MNDRPIRTCRIAVRSDGGLILGKNAGVLEPGMVYEIRDILGELTLIELGQSAACIPHQESGRPSWSSDASVLIRDAVHLLTVDEVRSGTVQLPPDHGSPLR